MAKQAGLCFERRTNSWRPCAQNITSGRAGVKPPICCLAPACCLDCDDLNAIRICAHQNLQIFFDDAGYTFGAVTPPGEQLIRQWSAFSTAPGGCTTWLPGGNVFPSTLENNGSEVPCYTITSAINASIAVNDGDIIPVGLVFTTSDSANCKDFGIFFLLQADDDGTGTFKFTILSSKYCTNFNDITDQNSYENLCNRCNSSPAPAPTCQILASDNATGGVGDSITINLGDVAFGSNPTINYVSIIIPDCCTETIDDTNFSVVQNDGFANAIINFNPTPPSGPGNWDIFIRFLDANVEGTGVTRFQISTTNCGLATITVNYNVLAP